MSVGVILLVCWLALTVLDLAVAGLLTLIFGLSFKRCFCWGLLSLAVPVLLMGYGILIERNCYRAKTVEIPFDEYTFRYFDISSKRFETEGGEYQIFVGSSSKDLLLDGVITKEGTVSVGPYDVEKIRHYMKGEVREVPDAEFKEILGSDIPEKDLRFIKKHRIEVDYNTSVSDLRYAKGWTGRLTERVIRHLIGFLRWIGKRTTANTLVMGVYYNPVRAFSRMTGAAISMAQLDGLIMMFNGHFFKGLHHFFKMGRARKKAQKAKEKAEKGK